MEFGSKVSDGEFHAPRQYAGGLHAELHDHAENDQSQDIFPVLFSDKQTQKRDRDVGTDEHIEIPQMHSASLAQEHVIHKNLHVDGRALDKRNKNSPPCGIKEQPEQEQQNNGQQVFAVKSTWRFILLFIQQQCAGQHHKHGRARAAQAVEDVPDHKGRVVSPAEIGDHIGRYMDHDNHGNRYNSDDVIAQYSLAGHRLVSLVFLSLIASVFRKIQTSAGYPDCADSGGFICPELLQRPDEKGSACPDTARSADSRCTQRDDCSDARHSAVPHTLTRSAGQ